MKHIDSSANDISNLKVGYVVDEAILRHDYEYVEKNESGKVIKDLVLYELNSDGTLHEVGRNDLSVRMPEGNFSTQWGYQFTPGNKYVLVTESPTRGDFGSATITIPGVPTIDPVASDPEKTEHFGTQWHDNVGYRVAIRTNLKCEAMGYNSNHPLGADDYYIGMMRRHTSPMLRAQGADQWSVDDEGTEMIHHWDGRQTEVDADVCSDCHSEISTHVEHDDEVGPIYTDHVEVPYGSAVNLEYLTRVYVKLPDNMLRTSEPTYMLAEAATGTSAPIVSGIENVAVGEGGSAINLADFDESEIRYFDMQGRQIARPAPGTPCIIATPAGSFITMLR